ncbi:MAG TPA: hypothetical protein VML94_03345 [Thermoplasmata archaeon]|nr:hypothetical protein [Thermoplasmata archaeon]
MGGGSDVSGALPRSPDSSQLQSPHPGTIDAFELAASGAATVDPAIAYDTISYEPILNVYETLVNYNGSSTTSFVPTLATCVPSTVQCVSDYGTNLTGYAGSRPIDWTFVLDDQANFYDPTTHVSWGVYPSDVMFSIARALSFSDLPYEGKTPGWMLGQALLPTGRAGWDAGLHYPFNTSSTAILGSMLVNASAFCPAVAVADEHGCISFVADGGGAAWPFFLDLISNNLGASIVPCGWFSYESAGMPGWGTNAGRGDGSCGLPGGTPGHPITTTDSPAWATYLSGLNPESWDSFEEAADGAPSADPGVQWSMVGSGPYFAQVREGVGYNLSLNPAYEQPGGCSGAGVLATYSGGCDPAPSSFLPTVHVVWESTVDPGIGAYLAHQADFASMQYGGIHTEGYGDGYWNTYVFPTLVQAFTTIDLDWSASAYASEFPSEPTPTVPSTFFTSPGLRAFYTHSYPYQTVERTIHTVDGVPFSVDAGGPIPLGMGDYYPANVSFPGGSPDTDPADVGGAAWWWSQITDPSSSYYDPQLSTCSPSTPCTFPILGLVGDPAGAGAIADWVAEIDSLSGNALRPFTFNLTYLQYLDFLTTPAEPYHSPIPSFDGLGWAPDFPDPTDYVTPEISPNQTFTVADSFSEQVGYHAQSAANISACGHYGSSFSDLVYWAHAASDPAGGQLNETCQGVAYSAATYWIGVAANESDGPARVLDYDLIEQITNGLSMYVWDGQTNEVTTAAPWISAASIDRNPMIGGGGDEVWSEIRYQPYLNTVTFQASGLPAGAPWSVSANGSIASENASAHGRGTLVLHEPNGTLSFSLAYPVGYGVSHVTGHGSVSQNQTTVSGRTTVAIAFGPIENLTFAETGLPTSTLWGVTLSSGYAHGGPAGTLSETSDRAAVNFSVVKGSWRFVVSVVPPSYRAHPAHGTLTLGRAAKEKTIRFDPIARPHPPIPDLATGPPAFLSAAMAVPRAASRGLPP